MRELYTIRLEDDASLNLSIDWITVCNSLPFQYFSSTNGSRPKNTVASERDGYGTNTAINAKETRRFRNEAFLK